MQLYKSLALKASAITNCERSNNVEWLGIHRERMERLVKEHMPSGSGIDNGTTLDDVRTTDKLLVFRTSFHHMDEHGGYDGWTDHAIMVRPDMISGIDISVSGRNRNDIKTYLADVFRDALMQEVSE